MVTGSKLNVFLIIIVAICFCVQESTAQTDIFIKGSGKLYPIALPQLCLKSGESDAVREIPRTIGRDLDISGYFEVLNQNSFIESPGKCNPESFAYSDWSVIGTEGLVKGTVSIEDGEMIVALYLHDVQQQRIVLAKEYRGHRSHAVKIAHRFANEIMRFFTGQYGIFGTRIAFSSRIGRFKELFVMDMDGSNIRQLTDDKGLAVSAAWNPEGTRLVYTSYRKRVPELFLLDVESRRISQITRSRELELGPEFSPDGSFLAALSKGAHSDIVKISSSGAIERFVTRSHNIIDVSPVWSPDGAEIAFCSNRAGGPQIYKMDASGRNVKRISYVNSSYCTSPAWSPRGDRIAYVCRAERGFHLFTSRPDGKDAIQLTSYGSNEDPSWSPDGNYLTFASTFGRGSTYHIAIIKADGTNLKQITTGKTSDMHPAWGPNTDG